METLSITEVCRRERIDEWSNMVEPLFSKAVWEAMKAASAAQRAATGTGPE